MGTPLRSLVLLTLAAVVALTGLVLGPARAAGDDELFRRHVLEGGRVVLDLPARWPALRPEDARFPGTAPTLASRHADLAPLLLGLAQPDSGLHLLAFDPRSRGAVTANVLVRVGQAQAVSYDRWTRDVVAAIRRSSGLVGPVKVRTLRVAAGRALRVDYTRTPRGRVQRVALTQLWVSRRSTTVAVSFATTPKERGRYAPTLARILASVDVRP